MAGRAEAFGIGAVVGLSAEEKERGDVSGYVAKIVNDQWTDVKTRLSQGEYHALRLAALPPNDAKLRGLLQGFPHNWADAYFRHNKLVSQFGTDAVDVVPRIPGFTVGPADDPEGELQVERELDEMVAKRDARRKERQGDRKKPRYYLGGVLGDSSVMEKMGFNAAIVSVLSKMAVANPVAACTAAQGFAKDRGFDVEIAVGNYARGRKASRNNILSAAEGLEVSPYTLTVLGDKGLIESPDTIRAGVCAWTIQGSIWQMPEMSALYRIAVTRGISVISTLFTMDMIVLGITLDFNSRADYGLNYEQHFGHLQLNNHGTDGSALPQSVRDAGASVYPVLFDDRVVATAFGAGGGQVYVNWHVVNQQGTSDLTKLRVRNHRGILSELALVNEACADVWLADVLEVDFWAGDERAPLPVVRGALVREACCYVYAGVYGVEYSDVVSVERVERSVVVTPRPAQANSGVSGAALVALSDGAVLGVYDGSTPEWSIASSLYKPILSDYRSRQANFSVSAPASPVGNATALYSNMVERGLESPLRNVTASVKPLYNKGRHVGLSVACQEWLHTVLDPTLWHVVDENGVEVRFTGTRAGGVQPLPAGVEQVAFTRAPVRGDEVTVLTVDRDGACLSQLLTVVWVSSDGLKFRLSSVPRMAGVEFTGGVVVGVADAAALGLFSGSQLGETGEVADCSGWQGFMLAAGVSTGLRDDVLLSSIGAVSESLHVVAWTERDVAAVGLKDKALAASYRRIGKSALVAIVAADLLKRGADTTLASTLADDEAWLLDKATLVFGAIPGWGAFDSSLRCAMLLAFLGAVWMREGADVFSFILDELGVFDPAKVGVVRTGLPRPVSSSF